MAKIIDEMFAFTVIDPNDGNEGVLGFLKGNQWIPMVGADMERVETLRPMADSICRGLELTYRIKRFVYIEDIE